MSRAIHHDHLVTHDAHEVAMEVIESPDALEEFLCVPMPVAEHAVNLVAPPEADKVPAVQRSARRFWH